MVYFIFRDSHFNISCCTIDQGIKQKKKTKIARIKSHNKIVFAAERASIKAIATFLLPAPTGRPVTRKLDFTNN
jgi:hypothetical protein